MNAQVALLLFAGVLLLIAILGGGFEIRELKVPKVEKIPRVLAGLGGVLFLILGLSVGGVPETRRDPPLNQPTRVRPPIQFLIFDQLEPRQIALGQSEQALIRIDGNPIGTLTVNEHFPKAELNVNVSNQGQHSFAIEATGVFSVNNKLTDVNCYGTGMIDVTAGARFIFEARYDERGGPCLAWLEKR
jgi:hypothetical protein